MTDLISRADAIEIVLTYFIPRSHTGERGEHEEDFVRTIFKALPSAEAVSMEEHVKELNDLAVEWKAKFVKAEKITDEIYDETMAKVAKECEVCKERLRDIRPSAEAEWIPCNTQMPDELEAVNVTWVNHLAPPYYKHIEGVPFVDSAVYYKGKWYWWDATVIDVLAEYGEDCNAEQIDKDIEILAWMPLPTPYKGGDDE